MFSVFATSYRLRITYRVNSIIYSLKQLPLVRRLLPSALYRSRGLKRFACVIAILMEILGMFLQKGAYLGIVVLAPVTQLLPPDTWTAGFLHILLFLSIAGAVSNNRLFDPTRDKYYAIILMRMDARRFTVSNYIYELLKLFIGFAAFLGVCAGLGILPWWCVILCPLLPCALKCISGWYSLRKYEKKRIIRNENSPVKAVWGTIALCWALAFAPLAWSWTLPVIGFWLFAVLSLLLAAFALVYICRFRLYRPMYQVLLSQGTSAVQLNLKKITDENYRKSISADTAITSHKKGYAYFNELFVKRHQKLLLRYAKRMTLITLALVAAAAAALVAFPQAREVANELVLMFLPYFIFLIYSFNSGKSVVQAMFRNCDRSMLTYSFYRRPDVILSLFKLRLRDVILINLMPASVLALGLPLLIWLSGGTDNILVYPIVLLCIMATSAFFSIHYLTCYYLLQPYNEATETKSSTYGVVMGITYLVCFAFIYLRMDPIPFGCVMIIFSVLYAVIARILVYRLAPSTFRLRR